MLIIAYEKAKNKATCSFLIHVVNPKDDYSGPASSNTALERTLSV